MESALEDARATAARAEDRVSASAGEIRKGNQIIERLQATPALCTLRPASCILHPVLCVMCPVLCVPYPKP